MKSKKDIKDDSDSEQDDVEEDETEKKKEKRKKRKKNKKAKHNQLEEEFQNLLKDTSKNWIPRELNLKHIYSLSDWKSEPTVKSQKWYQTLPPTISLDMIYPNNNYPTVEQYKNNEERINNEDNKNNEKKMGKDLLSCRKAAECHRNIRHQIQSIIKPNYSTWDLVNNIENTVEVLLSKNDINCSMAYPIGVNMNNIIANQTLNDENDNRVINKDDSIIIDLGIQINGNIIKSAFTITFEEELKELSDCVKESVYLGIKLSGIDARLSEISENMLEVINSKEIEYNGKTHKVKPIKNQSCNQLEKYKLNTTKQIHFDPLKYNKNSEKEIKMAESEQWCIGISASINGKGQVKEDLECNHQMKNSASGPKPIRMQNAKKLYSIIDKNYKDLLFCKRWLNNIGEKQHALPLKHLTEIGLISQQYPLCEVQGAKCASFEHTLVLKPSSSKEIFSTGDDY